MKIAFLFLLIDNPNFPELWDEYFKGHEDKYSLYIHPKYISQHTWRKENIISNIQETAWGFITRAYIELFKEAYKNKENIKFITISESCVPIKTFDKFYNDCLSENNINKSWIKIMKIKRYDFQERIMKHVKQIESENNKIIIPKINNFIKHYARFCLRREDVKNLLKQNSEGKMEFFNTMHVGDEFFLTVISPLNKENYVNFAVTFDDWDYVNEEISKINSLIKQAYENIEELQHNNKHNNKNNNKHNKEYKKNKKEILKLKTQIEELGILKKDIAKNPKTIIDVKPDLNNIKHTDSYFYRKFSKNSNIDEYWNSIINKN